MSELTTFDDMTIEAIEVACQSAFEECESVFRAIDSKKNQLEIFGRLLTAAKKKVAHGEWENWLTDTFHGRLPFRTAQRWMATAKAPEVALLKSDKVDHVPRSERKTGRVKVEQSASQSADVSEKVDTRPVDDDPNPAPQTNTLHKPATAKAKEADRPIPAAVTPEIVNEPGYDRQAWDDPVPEKTLADWSVDQMLAFLKDSADEPKKRAKELRKAADELDPPKKFSPPDLDDVRAYCLERKNKVDPEAFHAHYAANGWKQANGNKLADWKAAIITWEKRDDSGNRTTSTARSGNRRGLTAEEVFS
jgi:hypothetical protein